MTIWIIEPRDPLIARDGRPFGPDPGARASTLPFPPPSAIVGGLRHKAGMDADGRFDGSPATIERIKQLLLRGPILAELEDETDAVRQFLFPAPADAIVFEPAGSSGEVDPVRILRLAPRELPTKVVTNMPDGLQPVMPARRVPDKVSSRAPRFWHQSAFEHWLLNPQEDLSTTLDELGITGLDQDARMHVSVRPETQTAREGALFQTRGLEFTWRDRKAQQREEAFVTRRLGLAATFEDETGAYTSPHFSGGFAPLGGERRLMRRKTVDMTLPAPPDGLIDRVITEQRARVILITPAVFREGYRPPLAWKRGGVTAEIKAAAVPRAQVISGWDLHLGKPRQTRRLAPAGSVYFIEWPAGVDVRAWIDATWMQNISDNEQDRRDGFGLAVLGVWA
ncbi:MAG: type III-B CRISPR module-associated Cmr3 family protein [Chloroflexaceae bacterium]